MTRYRSLTVASVPLFAGLLLTLALGGCTNTSTTRILAKDPTVAFGELRMAYNLDNDKQPALPHTGNAIEFGAIKTRGSADQSLAAGQKPIIIGDTTFTAPQQLRNDVDFTYYDLSWRGRYFDILYDSKLALELFFGAGYSEVGLKVSSATQVAAERIENFGARAGGGLIYRLSPSSSFQARGSIFWAPLTYAVHDIGRYELVYAKAFLDNFRLRVGYARLHVFGYNSGKSDFQLDFSGPILALDLEF